jgi:hypothetical protein
MTSPDEYGLLLYKHSTWSPVIYNVGSKAVNLADYMQWVICCKLGSSIWRITCGVCVAGA